MAKIDINDYYKYLNTLEPKEIKKEVRSVAKELLIRQREIVDIDMAYKIMVLYLMSEDETKRSHNVWFGLKVNFIDPMMCHCLTVNIYACIAEILNNLSVSSYNEDLSTISKIKKWFLHIFEVAHNYSGQVNIFNKLAELLYS
jgi:hypothetical protein